MGPKHELGAGVRVLGSLLHINQIKSSLPTIATSTCALRALEPILPAPTTVTAVNNNSKRNHAVASLRLAEGGYGRRTDDGTGRSYVHLRATCSLARRRRYWQRRRPLSHTWWPSRRR